MRTDRLRELEHYMTEHVTATIPELCDRFGVSVNTMRRDIRQLVDEGRLTKVYGGVVINQHDLTVPFTDRSSIAVQEKLAIGRLAAGLVGPGDTIYIDSGSTAAEMVPHLDNLANLTVVSNSLIVQNRMLQVAQANLLTIGGIFSRKTLSCSGPIAVAGLGNIRIRKAFMSATAVNIEDGATNYSPYEAEIKQAAIARAHEVILMVDHTKFDRSAAICFCPLERLKAILTDRRPPERYVTYCRVHQIELFYPEATGT
ncbi:MAG: DeoR/GlpR family DNA-binding transcription regulator [Bacillota bacterium]|nr:DeoR/GlpR family DNA-binding transcription regulator [Bacillota bacterium]